MKIVITGVSRGLGRVLVEGMTAEGHQVAGCARSSAAVESLQEQFGPPHHFAVVDVSDVDAVQRWAEATLAAMGAPDLLINNAALINQSAPLWEVPIEEFSRLIDVNIKGMYYVIKAFLPSMIEAERGIVVNLSSAWGRTPSSDVAPYCASKWAVEGLTQSLAMDLPTGLAAVPVNPGIINTDMLQTCFGEGAGNFPDAKAWSRQAVPFLLGLSAKDNGRPLTVPNA